MSHRAAFRGSLISRGFLLAAVATGPPIPDPAAARHLTALLRRVRGVPGASSRSVTDLVGLPLANLLGYQTGGVRVSGDLAVTPLTDGVVVLALLVCVPVGTAIENERVRIATDVARHGARWTLVLNGESLVLLDGLRAHARRWLRFDLELCALDPGSLQALFTAAGARALEPGPGGRRPLDTLIAGSDAALAAARAALQEGVERAAVSLTRALSARGRGARSGVGRLFEEALTVVYRILFLRFAESRGLVPTWHPTYRDAYTIEALRDMVQLSQRPGSSGTEAQRKPRQQRRRGHAAAARGLWDSLQAISRLAHLGAEAGDLTVVPFNGRLFSPAHAPVVSSAAIPDTDAAGVIAALTLLADKPASRSRARSLLRRPLTPIPYVDLGVEQLGSIYERVLDFTPEIGRDTGQVELRRGSSRKHTGSFYTPRSLAEFLVRRTLAPLTEDRAPEEILALKVLDPAMGSGAFLVAACRYLASAYENALVRSGVAGATDCAPADRAMFRRAVARRCLYGVDVNPMAVQLGRLSLWLCSLAADRPLTFLDHRLRVGNSLLGASPGDVGRRAPGGPQRGPAPTLFTDDLLESIGRAVDVRSSIAAAPDDSVADVTRKEALLSALDSAGGPLHTWKRLCNAWCAMWFWPDGRPPDRREFGAMTAAIRGEDSFSHTGLHRKLAQADTVAASERFFHWPLEFPEAIDGFDALVGNPPWEMLRADSGQADARAVRQALRFTRDSGVYTMQSSGHGNAYQLFVERALQLLRPGGRTGLVLPWGLFSDEGSAPLRRALMSRCALDDLVVLDNRDAIFPIHRALRFVALCGTRGGRTDALRYREPVRDLAELDRVGPDRAGGLTREIELSRDLLMRVSGDSLAVPWVTAPAEVVLLERLTRAAPAAGDPRGWGLRFGRELNASDDRALLSDRAAVPDGYPVLAGRHVQAFRVEVSSAPLRIDPADARAKLGSALLRPRLAYRDVAGPGNRMTLIAAIVPARVVTTHTLFCLRTRLDPDEQHFLCALLNSYVANYLVRTRVSTHVTTALVHGLPLPRPGRSSEAFGRLTGIARSLAAGRREDEPELQARVARLYGLDRDAFALVLDTFPLVPRHARDAALAAWAAV